MSTNTILFIIPPIHSHTVWIVWFWVLSYTIIIITLNYNGKPYSLTLRIVQVLNLFYKLKG